MYFIPRRGAREKVKGFAIKISAASDIHKTFFEIADVYGTVSDEYNYEPRFVIGRCDNTAQIIDITLDLVVFQRARIRI